MDSNVEKLEMEEVHRVRHSDRAKSLKGTKVDWSQSIRGSELG